jgi:hypothetical protein
MVEESIAYYLDLDNMTVESQIDRVPSIPAQSPPDLDRHDETTPVDSTNESQPAELILCPHCLRTASNGLKCKGICVADSDY